VNEEERAGMTESLFREVNERIDDLGVNKSTEDVSILCECATRECAEQLVLPDAVYAHVRTHSTWFLVRPGHEEPAVETVVVRREGYVIVEKRGEAAEQAERMDPRTRGE
jgi:hypothetical protein